MCLWLHIWSWKWGAWEYHGTSEKWASGSVRDWRSSQGNKAEIGTVHPVSFSGLYIHIQVHALTYSCILYRTHTQVHAHTHILHTLHTHHKKLSLFVSFGNCSPQPTVWCYHAQIYMLSFLLKTLAFTQIRLSILQKSGSRKPWCNWNFFSVKHTNYFPVLPFLNLFIKNLVVFLFMWLHYIRG